MDSIWRLFFNIDKKIFKKKKNYVFDGMIFTDGYGVSILFINKNEKGSKYNANVVNKKYKTTYIESLKKTEKNTLFKKYEKGKNDINLVGIDPGKIDLLFATNGEVKKINKGNKIINKPTYLSYSHARRKHECRMNKYRKIIEKDKKRVKIHKKTVKEIET